MTEADSISTGSILGTGIAVGPGAHAEVHYHTHYNERRQSSVPFLAPGLPPHYVPREPELIKLRRMLLESEHPAQVIALRGMGGIGKTTMAIALCHDCAVIEAFPGGILWATLGPKPDIASAQISWGEALGEDLAKLPTAAARADQLRSLLHSRRCLIIVDDVWRAEDLPLFQVGGSACITLVTTRERKIAQKVGWAQDLDVLSPEQALALLEQWAGEIPAEERADAGELAKRLGYLPLALALAGAQSQDGQTWSGLLAAFRNAQGADISLLDLDEPTTRDESLALTFSLSIERLGEALPQQFALLGAFAGGREAPFESPAAAAVWQLPLEETKDSLDRLVRAALLNRHDGSYWMHLLLNDFARSQLSAADRTAAEQRHTQHYFGVAQHSVQDWQATDRALPQLRRAWERIPRHDADTLFIWPESLTVFLSRRGYWDDYIAMANAACTAAHVAQRPEMEGWAQNWLGVADERLGRTEVALERFQNTLSIMRTAGNRFGQATALTNIAGIYYRNGQPEQALSYYQESLPLWHEAVNRMEEAGVLNSLGRIYEDRGEMETAFGLYKQSLELAHMVGDQVGEATSLRSIGGIDEKRGELDRALMHYEQSRALMHDSGEKRGEAATLLNIGHIHYRRGAFDSALAQFQASLELHLAIGDRRGQAITINDIGAVYYAQKRLKEALEQFQNSLSIVREVHDRRQEAVTLWNIGVIYAQLNQLQDAEKPLIEALELYKAMGMAEAAKVQLWLDHVQGSR